MDPNAARSRALKRLMRPLQLTRMGMIAERVLRSFWPVWTLIFALVAALAFGAHDALPPQGVWIVGGAWLLAIAAAVGLGIRAYRRPSGKEVVARLDATLPGRPIKALSDKQAIGAGDFGSEAVWNAHVERMAARIEAAKAVRPDLRLSDRDPYALRYAALVALVTALLFGSLWRITSLDDAAGAGPGAALATGPSWEGWIEPPAYTGKPSLYLNDIAQAEFTVPEGSEVTIRLYGEVGALSVRETVSGRVPEGATGEAAGTPVGDKAAPAPVDDGVRSFAVNGSGEIEIDGSGGRQWTVLISPDSVPAVELVGEIDKTAVGELQQRFRAEDDYGVVAGSARITLDEGALNRRYGLVADPEPREPVTLDLPMTISGDRASFEETLIDDLSKHPWANLPVVMQLSVTDARGQQGRSLAKPMVLPGRRFFDPAAAALIELRRDLLWSRENAARTAQILRTITWKPTSALAQPRHYLQARMVLKRLEAEGTALGEATRDELAEALWEIAVRIEEGTLSDALERLRQAQERLSEAIRNGASDEEIAQLMEEMRQAMQDYMRQLAQQQDPNQQQQQGQQGQTMELSQQDLQDMLDRLQELMEQGRTAEAQELLNQLMEMMQNMQVTRGPGGQGGQSPGEQAMEGLAETLRDQQGLSDEAFRDLQEQFNPNGQQGQQGQDGQQGQGQGQQGQGEGQQGQGQGEGEGQQPGGQEPDARSLAQRQNELRRELERQRGQLPGAGTEQGDAARRSLDEAGRAMDRAEESLRRDDLADAIDNQSQAIERLREGMRALGEAMAEERRQQQGGQGENVGRADPNNRRDPLGRDLGSSGPLGTEEQMLQGDDVYRRARDLLDEIRRRSSEQGRPDVELEYLKRLLERF